MDSGGGGEVTFHGSGRGSYDHLAYLYGGSDLSARDIKDWLSFLLAKELTETDMIHLMCNRHRRRQLAINSCYLKEYINVSK